MNDVALTVNKTLKILASLFPNVHYISHPWCGGADAKVFEDSPECSPIARDRLHLSLKGCMLACRDIMEAVGVFSGDAAGSVPSPRPASTQPASIHSCLLDELVTQNSLVVMVNKLRYTELNQMF